MKGGRSIKRVFFLLSVCTLALLAASVALAGPQDNSLIAANETKLLTLDLYDTTLRDLIILYNELSDPLVGRNPQTMKLDPDWSLAESWKQVDDITLEFKLKPGIKHHTGNPLTSEDFRWLIEDRILKPEAKSPQRGNMSWAKKVEVKDALIFRVIAEKPYAPALERLNTMFGIDSKYIKEKGLPYFAEHPVGTGPFKFVRWDKGSVIEFVKNPNYWRKGLPRTDRFVMRIIPERSTQLAELLAGGLDFIRDVPPDQVKTIDANPKTKTASTPILRIVFIVFDTKNRAGTSQPVMDKRVRQAIWHAIDIDSILKNVLLGYATRIYTPLNPWHFGFDPTIKNPYPYDPEKARKLLAEAKYPKGYKLQLTLHQDPEYCQAIQGMLGEVGITVEIRDMQANVGQFSSMQRAGQLPGMQLNNWGSYNVFDADAMFYTWLHSSDDLAFASSPETDKLLDDARGSLDPAKRMEMYVKVQKWAVDNAVIIPSHARHTIYGVSKKLHFEPVGDEVPRFYRASWEK